MTTVTVRIIDSVQLRSRDTAKARLSVLMPQLEEIRSKCLGAQEHVTRLTKNLLETKARLVLARTMLGEVPVCSANLDRPKGFSIRIMGFKGVHEPENTNQLGRIPDDPGERFKVVSRYSSILDARIRAIETMLSIAENVPQVSLKKMQGLDSDVRQIHGQIKKEHTKVELTKTEVGAAIIAGLGALSEATYQTFNLADTATMMATKVFAGLVIGTIVFYFMLRDGVKQCAQEIERTRSIAEVNLNMIDLSATSNAILKPLGDLRKAMEQTIATCSKGVVELIETANPLTQCIKQT